MKAVIPKMTTSSRPSPPSRMKYLKFATDRIAHGEGALLLVVGIRRYPYGKNVIPIKRRGDVIPKVLVPESDDVNRVVGHGIGLNRRRAFLHPILLQPGREIGGIGGRKSLR